MGELAGFELLDRFERGWNQIHIEGVRNSNEVKKMVKLASNVEKKCHKMENSYIRFHEQLQTLPTMTGSIDAITVTLGRLQGQFNDLQEILSLLESVCEEGERVEKILRKNEEVHALKLARQKEFEDLKVGLAKDHSLLLERLGKTRRGRKGKIEKALLKALWNTDLPSPSGEQ